jgi:hypothetical protein
MASDITTPLYTSWGRVPAGLHAATHWRKLGFRIQSAAPRAYVRGRRGSYALYTKEDFQPVQRRKLRPPVCLPFTSENLGKALWEINKAAKRRAITASQRFVAGNHERAKLAKAEKVAFYLLKDRMLGLLLEQGVAVIAAYHSVQGEPFQRSEGRASHDMDDSVDTWGDFDADDTEEYGQDNSNSPEERRLVLQSIVVGGFRFHRPITCLPEGANISKTLAQGFSKAAPITWMRLCDAEETLWAYLKQKTDLPENSENCKAAAVK